MYPCRAKVRRGHHGAQRRLDRSPWVGQEVGDAGEGFVRLSLEDVQDCPDQERMARLFPMIPALQRPLGIH